MDPATLAMAITAIADVTKTLQQYSNGTITTDQAHAQFLAAHVSLLTAVVQFQQAGVPKAPA